MTEGPIATAYVEIRPTPDSKNEFKRDMARAVEPAAAEATDRIRRGVSDGLKTPIGTIAAGTAIGNGITAGLRTAMRGASSIVRTGIGELGDYQAGLAQLQAGVKSTGNVVGLTTAQMEGLASSIEKYSGQTDDSIVRAEGFLLTFDKVRDSIGAGNDIFTRATKASADLAARGFGTAESSAVQLGKALQDPARGLAGLSKVGVTFTEQQKAQIKALNDTGRSLEAQRILLAAVEKQVEGSAAAFGETLPGKIAIAKRSFEGFTQTVTEKTLGFASDNTFLVGSALTVVGGLVGLTKAVKTYRDVRETLFARQGKRIAGNIAEAASIDAIAVAERGAAGAAASRAGGLFGALAVNPVTAIAAGSLFSGYQQLKTTKSVGMDAAANRQLVDDAKTLEDARKAAAALAAKARDLQAKQDNAGILDVGKQFLGFDRGGDLNRWASADNQAKRAQDKVRELEQEARDAAMSAVAADPLSVARRRAAGSSGRLDAAMAARRDPRTLVETGVVGFGFDVLPSRSTGDPAAARERVRAAQVQEREARAALTEARAGGGGARPSQIAGAEASVAAARAALRKRGGDSDTEQRRLEAAEARLSELRAKGGVDTDKIREAEDRLASARRGSKTASEDLRKAEKGTALTVGEALKRLSGQTDNAKRLVADQGKLIKAGVSEQALTALNLLEKAAPGTLDNFARDLTPAMANALNKQYADLSKLQFQFTDATRVAGLREAAAAASRDEGGLYKLYVHAQREAMQRAIDDKGEAQAPLVVPPPSRRPPHGAAPIEGGRVRPTPHAALAALGVGARGADAVSSVVRLHEEDAAALRDARPVTVVLTGARAEHIRQIARHEVERGFLEADRAATVRALS